MPAGLPKTRVASALDEAAAPATEAVLAPESGPVRIVVFNDHPVFRTSLSWKAGEGSGIELIADAASLSETLQTAADQPDGFVDAVVADLRIGDGNSEGVESVKTLASRLDGIPVIVYSDQYSRSFATRVNDAGAAAMVRKSAGVEQLVDAVHGAVVARRAADSSGHSAA